MSTKFARVQSKFLIRHFLWFGIHRGLWPHTRAATKQLKTSSSRAQLAPVSWFSQNVNYKFSKLKTTLTKNDNSLSMRTRQFCTEQYKSTITVTFSSRMRFLEHLPEHLRFWTWWTRSKMSESGICQSTNRLGNVLLKYSNVSYNFVNADQVYNLSGRLFHLQFAIQADYSVLLYIVHGWFLCSSALSYSLNTKSYPLSIKAQPQGFTCTQERLHNCKEMPP